jgi:cytochrome c oxidase subunit 2
MAALLASGAAAAQTVAGEPVLWQMWHTAPASPIAEWLEEFHTLLVFLITAICLFVFGLLAYAMWRFREGRNPVPSRTTHNTAIEVLWTVVPVLILVVIAIPSFRILYAIENEPPIELTVKVIGHQWYWEYQFPDHGDLAINSIPVPDADIRPGQRRVYEVDQRLVLPVDTNIRLQITSADVLHSWAVGSIGFTRDAVPGRLNETWTRIEKEGVHFGHCRELCGTGHPFMPVAIEAVSKERFEAWIAERRTAAAPAAPRTYAEGPAGR